MWFYNALEKDGSWYVYQTRIFFFDFPHHIVRLVVLDICYNWQTKFNVFISDYNCDRPPIKNHPLFWWILCFGRCFSASFVFIQLAELFRIRSTFQIVITYITRKHHQDSIQTLLPLLFIQPMWNTFFNLITLPISIN